MDPTKSFLRTIPGALVGSLCLVALLSYLLWRRSEPAPAPRVQPIVLDAPSHSTARRP